MKRVFFSYIYILCNNNISKKKNKELITSQKKIFFLHKKSFTQTQQILHGLKVNKTKNNS